MTMVISLQHFNLQGPFCTGTGAGGLSLTTAAAYNPTYAAALYGAAFGASGAYDPAVFPAAASYPGLPGYPGYSPGTFAATASEYPGGGYALPYGAGRDIRYPGMQGVQNKEVLNAQ